MLYQFSLLLPETQVALLQNEFPEILPPKIHLGMVTIATPEELNDEERKTIDTSVASIGNLLTLKCEPHNVEIEDIVRVSNNDGTFFANAALATLDASTYWNLGLGEGSLPPTATLTSTFRGLVVLTTNENSSGTDFLNLIGTQLLANEVEVINVDTEETVYTGFLTGADKSEKSEYMISHGYGECENFALVKISDRSIVGCYDSWTSAADALSQFLDTKQAVSESVPQPVPYVGDGSENSLSLTPISVIDGIPIGDKEKVQYKASCGNEIKVDNADAFNLTVVADLANEIKVDSTLAECGDSNEDSEDCDATEESDKHISLESDPLLRVFEGELAFLDVESGDRRIISPDNAEDIIIDNLPLPLMYLDRLTEGHQESRICGEITEVYLRPAAGMDSTTLAVYGSGRFFDTEVGEEAFQMVAKGYLQGVSLDLDMIKSEVLTEGSSIDDGTILKITKCRVRGATIVPFPAFINAKIWLPYSPLTEATDYVEDYADPMLYPTEIFYKESNDTLFTKTETDTAKYPQTYRLKDIAAIRRLQLGYGVRASEMEFMSTTEHKNWFMSSPREGTAMTLFSEIKSTGQ